MGNNKRGRKRPPQGMPATSGKDRSDCRGTGQGFSKPKTRPDFGKDEDAGVKPVIASTRNAENDPGWYLDPVDVRHSYFNMSFEAPLGRTFMSQSNSVFDNASAPGVMAYSFVPTIGVSSQANDAVNVAADRIYSFVRFANSGSRNYDPTDLMIYILAHSSAETMICYLQRIYGVLMMYSKYNWYLPDTLLRAMHVAPDDMRKHILDLLGFIRITVAKLSALAVPANISYSKRHAWLASNLFVDNKDSAKAQVYLFVPQSFYKFALDSNGAGMLQQTRLFDVTNDMGQVFDDALLTFDELVAFTNQLIDPLIAQEDFGIMSGDIMKAYGSGIRVIQNIDDSYRAELLYSEEALSQIENATVFSGCTNTNVTQVNGVPGVNKSNFLVSNPKVEFYSYIASGDTSSATMLAMSSQFTQMFSPQANQILNFHHDGPSPEDVAVASRLKAVVLPSSTLQNWTKRTTGYINWVFSATLQACGSEVIVGARMYHKQAIQISGSPAVVDYVTDIPSIMPVVVRSSGTSSSELLTGSRIITTRLEQLASFDWHHGVYVYGDVFTVSNEGVLGISNTFNADGVAMDLDVFTWLSSDNIINMHNAALLNELWIPTRAD